MSQGDTGSEFGDALKQAMNPVDYFFGELTGRNAQRKAAAEAKAAIREEKAASAKAIEESNYKKYLQDVQLSNYVGAITKKTSGAYNPEKDFLGI